MPEVRVHRSRIERDSISARIEISGESHELSFRLHRPRPVAAGDVWMPIALLIAMRLGHDLFIEDRVSRRLLAAVPTIQDILGTWYSADFSRIDVTAPSSARWRPRLRPQVVQAFTGGVDSYFTLLTGPGNGELLYLHDLVHDIPAVRDRMREHLGAAAKSSGRTLREVEHHVRHVLDDYAEWAAHSHGAVIAAAAAAAAGSRSTDFLIPSTLSYNQLTPHGSHALLDPLWSGDRMRVVHHGATATRLLKIQRIASNSDALRFLRVCWRTQTEVNCGRCEKCLRTMTSLELLGKLSAARTFAHQLNLDELAAAEIGSAGQHLAAVANLEFARLQLRDDVAIALESQLACSPFRA